jgi:hypothetical protein
MQLETEMKFGEWNGSSIIHIYGARLQFQAVDSNDLISYLFFFLSFLLVLVCL